MFKPKTVIARTTLTKSSDKMQIPCLGTQQGEDQDENTSPKEQKEEQELKCRPPTTESLHSGALF